jgi:PleD family two-component response regulator
MSRILLADDSPHAQRMGERILRDEGYEVVSITDGNTVLLRLADVDPDVILADVFLPSKSGLDICRYVKDHARHRHVRIVMIAGVLEPFDEEEARRAGADAVIKKPFEASAMLETIRPLIEQAQRDREARHQDQEPLEAPVTAPDTAQAPESGAPAVEPERVRAAVTIALDAAMPALIEEITERVLIALGR